MIIYLNWFLLEIAITCQILILFPKSTLILYSLHIRKKKLDSNLLNQKVVNLLYSKCFSNFNHFKNVIISSDVYRRTESI